MVTLASTPTSLLEAVNLCIMSLGEAQVATLDPSPSIDVDDALAIITDEDRKLQNTGWHWNREYSLPLTLGLGGVVPVPANTLRITTAYAPGTPTVPTDFDVRGGNLYDLENHTFTWTAAPTVDLIFRKVWDDLPDAARRLISLRSVKRFQANKEQGSIVIQVAQGDINEALATLEQNEDEVAPTNAVNGSANVVSVLYGVGGMRRNRGGQ